MQLAVGNTEFCKFYNTGFDKLQSFAGNTAGPAVIPSFESFITLVLTSFDGKTAGPVYYRVLTANFSFITQKCDFAADLP